MLFNARQWTYLSALAYLCVKVISVWASQVRKSPLEPSAAKPNIDPFSSSLQPPDTDWQRACADRLRMVTRLFYTHMHPHLEHLHSSSSTPITGAPQPQVLEEAPPKQRFVPFVPGSNRQAVIPVERPSSPATDSPRRLSFIDSPARVRSPRKPASPSAGSILARAGSGSSNESPQSIYRKRIEMKNLLR